MYACMYIVYIEEETKFHQVYTPTWEAMNKVEKLIKSADNAAKIV